MKSGGGEGITRSGIMLNNMTGFWLPNATGSPRQMSNTFALFCNHFDSFFLNSTVKVTCPYFGSENIPFSLDWRGPKRISLHLPIQ